MVDKRRQAGSGSVYQRADGKWVAQLRYFDPFAGKSVKRRRYATSKRGAAVLLKELRGSATPATGTPAMLLADWFESWKVNNLPHAGLAPTTARVYGDYVTWYAVPAAGAVTLDKFTPTLAEQFTARLIVSKKRNGDQVAISTARNAFNACLRALDVAVRDGLMPTNPLRSVKRPAAHYAPVPVTGADDTDRLLTAARGEHIEPLIVTAVFTGARIGELLSLRWSDVDLDADPPTATIRRGTLHRESTKTGRKRSITLLPEVVAQLRVQRRRQRLDRVKMGAGWQDLQGLVFTSGTGRPVDRRNATAALVRILKRAGVDPARPWHSLRHGLAHRLLAGGVPVQMVSAVLGHSKIGTTVDVYGHTTATVPVDVLTQALDRG